MFARFLRAAGLTAYRPHSIVTSAEILEEGRPASCWNRSFGCPVYNRYGCREVSVVASECPAHSGLHVMAEGLYLEIETPHGPAAPGEMGAVLVTDLLNGAMPLIRYRIGDMAAWARRPLSVRPRPAAPGARGGARHRLPRRRRRPTRLRRLPGHLRRGAAAEPRPGADSPAQGGRRTYRIRPGRDFDPIADGEYLREATRQHLGEGAVCEWEIVDELPAEPSGKFLFSRSTVAPVSSRRNHESRRTTLYGLL